MPFFYRAFGLIIRSDVEVPSLEIAGLSPTAEWDAEFILGTVAAPVNPVTVTGMKVEVRPEGLVLEVEKAARFSVNRGRTIIFEPAPDATPGEVQAFLLGSALGLLLHQKGYFPLHANAVEIDGSVFAFCGDSGAGKSTLATHFHDQGLRLLTDDICAIHTGSDGRFVAWPGIPRLKLWRDAVEASGRKSEELRPVAWTNEKFELPMRSIATGGPFPVAGIFHLRTAGEGLEPGIHRMTGLQAANVMTANIYRRRLADLSGLAPAYLKTAVSIIAAVPIFSMNRRMGFEHFIAEAAAVQSRIAELIVPPPAI